MIRVIEAATIVFLFLSVLSHPVPKSSQETPNTFVVEEDGVAILTKDNFDHLVTPTQDAFVFFSAGWCVHCLNLTPHFSALARRVKLEGKNVLIAKVDCVAEKELASKLRIRGYPGLKYFSKNSVVDYKGGRTEREMMEWLDSRALPKAKLFKHVRELEKLDSLNLIVIYFIRELSESAIEKFENLAASYEFITFIYTHDPQILNKYKSEDPYVFVVQRGFDEGPVILSSKDELSTEEMKDFFEKYRYKLVMDFDHEAVERIFQNQLTTIIVFTNQNEFEDLPILQDIAEKARGRFFFSIALTTSEFGPKAAKLFNLKENVTEAIRIIDFKNGNLLKFKCYSDKVSEIEECINDFVEQTLERVIRSDPIPERHSGYLRIIVGLTFSNQVINSNEHVLLLIDAPWCESCKQLKPIFSELAKQLRHSNRLVVAIMDGTSNEVPSLELQEFPTILLFKRAHKDEPILYKGKHTLVGLMEFLRKKTGIERHPNFDYISTEL